MAGKPGVAGRTAAALADSARDRATIARQKARAKLLGHKRHCPDCGRTARSADQVAACRDRHKRERDQKAKIKAKTGPARGNPIGSGWGKAKAPRPGPHSCNCGSRGCKGNYRNDLEFNNHWRQIEERRITAEKRARERDRRTEAVKTRDARGGKPKGTPKTRGDRHTTKLRTPEARAEFHAHMRQHAAGRVDRDGTRVPHEPSPRKVQPRVRVEPRVR